jgi:hypothetical protein
MEDRHYILSDVARILGKKPHQVTYALTSRAVPEPEQRVASRRLFSRDDIVRLARHFKVAPKWSVLEVVGNGAKDEASHGLVLRPPFEAVDSGTACCEVRDGDGILFAWAADRGRALVMAGLLDAAARG